MGIADYPQQWGEISATRLPRPSLKDVNGPALLRSPGGVRAEHGSVTVLSALVILLTV